MAERLETINENWLVLKAKTEAGSSDAAHGATTSKNADIPATAVKRCREWNALEIAFTGHADGDTCGFALYAARRDGDIAVVFSGDITIGKQAATDGGYWADTIVEDAVASKWITTVTLVDAAGGDGMSRIVFDACGYDKFWVQFVAAEITGDEHYTAYYSGY